MTRRKKILEHTPDGHLTPRSAFEIGFNIFKMLNGLCPNCSEEVISMILPILITYYVEEGNKRDLTFKSDIWLKNIIKKTKERYSEYERHGSTVH